MNLKKLLNEQQIEAVTTPSQYARVIAGAGTGKTRVLTYRIAYLIGQKLIDPSHIVAITFTNKVANEMRKRVIKLYPEVASKLRVSTFHSFCARFLRYEINALGYPSHFTIYDDDDQEKLVKSIAVDIGYRKNDEIVKKALNYIAAKKCEGKYPSDINPNDLRLPDERECLRFFELYEKRMQDMYALDFDDLLLKTILILEAFNDVKQKWTKRIEHILIDEFQDTNDVQYHLVQLLLTPTTYLFVVGDPDQTIYTWRGANQNIILDIDKKYPTQTIILNRNYRSTPIILRSANRLIDNNRLRIKKDLFTKKADGPKIRINRSLRQIDEAAWVAREIMNLQRSTEDQFQFRDVAILYRANYLTLPFEKEFNRTGLPMRIFGGMRFFQRQEIKDVLAYLRLLVNKKDDISFLRIINIPRRGIGEKTIELLKSEAYENKLSLYEYVELIENFDSELKTKTIVALTSLLTIIDKYRLKLEEKGEVFSEILREYIVEIGYFDELKDADEQFRLENVKTLFDDMFGYIKEYPELGFQDYLQNVALTSSQDELDDGDYISLMTVHTAKGLEFKHVFVIGLNEGIFPSLKTINESAYLGLEEERRLAYVAFTRAQDSLFLSCNGDYSYILDARLIPSRFFKESGITFESRLPVFDTYSYRQSLDDGTAIAKQKNISDWQPGDKIKHDTFGEGEVISIIDKAIIEVDFASCGIKKMLANHPAIHRIEKVGGYA